MKPGQSIGVVIPALNEARAIAHVITDIPDFVDRVVVADNGSSDTTIETARAAGATVVEQPERGYGAACLRGLEELRDMDIIVFLDGDYSDHPQEMPHLIAPILKGDVQLVIGSRVLGQAEKHALTLQQRFGNGLACFLMRQIWNAQFTDLGPFRAITRTALDGLDMRDRNYGWTVEMQIKAARSKLASCEVPVRYRRRIGQSKVSGTVKGTILAGTKILALIAQFALKDMLHFRHKP